MNSKVIVFQTEYGFGSRKLGHNFIHTSSVWICTAWIGYDELNRVGFICHFDTPWSTCSTPQILADLAELFPNSHSFLTHLVGGKAWWWSGKTRKNIIGQINYQKRLKIDVKEMPLERSFCREAEYLLDLETGNICSQKKQIKSRFKLWARCKNPINFFRMRRSETSL